MPEPLTPNQIAWRAGAAWFAARPKFYASHEQDMWRCGPFFCEWDKAAGLWRARKRDRHDKRHSASTPAEALAGVGYDDGA